MNRQVGEPLNLRLSLNRDETTKYVRAFLTDPDGNAVATLDLDHIANGIYGENSYVMPDLEQLDVKYRVYFDAGFTVLDPTYPSAFDLFRKEDSSSSSVVVQSSTPDLVGEVEEETEISGDTQESDTVLEGTIEEEETVE